MEVTLARLALGAAVLFAIVPARREKIPRPGRLWVIIAVAALFANAVPYLLFAVAEQSVDSSTAGIINATTPLWTGGQQPDPRAELGRHIQHPLIRGQQLLGQQVAQPADALYRPGPLRPGRGPGQQPLRLGGAGTDPQLTQRLLGRADRHRRVRGLVRVNPDQHCHERPLPPRAR